jgi:Peptidase family M28
VSTAAPPSLDPDAIGSHVRRICGLGNRFVGSDGERAARELVLGEFLRFGLADPRLEPLTVLGYAPRAASCELVGGGRSPAVGLQFTADGVVDAEAVYLGAPRTREDLDLLEQRGVELNGAIAVLHTPVPFVFASRLAELGASGLVVISENLDGRIGNHTAKAYPPAEPPDLAGFPLTIPGVTIGAQAGRELLVSMAAGERRLRVEHRASYSPVETANVVAEIPGRRAPQERVVVGAHYDTQLEGVGACDNATGLAVLLELGRTWASLAPARTVVLVAFADEEHGCAGAVSYCRRHARELAATVGMVNLDALAWAYPARRALHSDPSIHGYAAARACSLGWRPFEEVEASLLAGSDVNPFIDAGVPACWFWRYPPPHPYYHSEGDDPELLELELVAETADVAAATAFSLARDPDLDLGRSCPTKRWLDLRPEAVLP